MEPRKVWGDTGAPNINPHLRRFYEPHYSSPCTRGNHNSRRSSRSQRCTGAHLEPLRQELEVVLPFREEDGTATFVNCLNHIIQDQRVTLLVLGKTPVELLNRHLSVEQSHLECGLANNQVMLERMPRCKAPGRNLETN